MGTGSETIQSFRIWESCHFPFLRGFDFPSLVRPFLPLREADAEHQRISLGHVLLREIKGNKKKLGLERARGYSNRYNFFCNRLVGLEIHGRMPKMSSELLLTAEIQHFQSEFGFLASLGSSRQLLQLLFLDRKIIEK